MSMRRIALETYRSGEEYARLQKEKDEIKRKREVEALFNEASELLKKMCAKKVTLLHKSSIDSYATSVPDVVFLQVDDELEFKAMRKKDAIELYVLSGGVYKKFTNLTELGEILHEETSA